MIGITKSVCKNKLLYDYNVQSVVCVSLRVYYTVEIKKKKKRTILKIEFGSRWNLGICCFRCFASNGKISCYFINFINSTILRFIFTEF